MEALGVMGDTGGRLGEADSERLRECSDEEEASLEEAGRGLVSTRSAGMTARWATSPGQALSPEGDRLRRLAIGDCHDEAQRHTDRSRSGPRVRMGNKVRQHG
jgi:hypothetical protein